jgi:predicted transcriptional regulator of viral defense system
MEGLSKKQIEVISELEFMRKYYFTRNDIKQYFRSNKQMTDFIYNLRRKGRIASLSKSKYYLIPIKARKGLWAEDSFIIADEMFNGQSYFIGGWAAAQYWHLTDQVPMKIEVYTTKRQGRKKILTTTFIFRRTTSKRTERDAVTQKMGEHRFRILSREKAKKWMRSRR